MRCLATDDFRRLNIDLNSHRFFDPSKRANEPDDLTKVKDWRPALNRLKMDSLDGLSLFARKSKHARHIYLVRNKPDHAALRQRFAGLESVG